MSNSDAPPTAAEPHRSLFEIERDLVTALADLDFEELKTTCLARACFYAGVLAGAGALEELDVLRRKLSDLEDRASLAKSADVAGVSSLSERGGPR